MKRHRSANSREKRALHWLYSQADKVSALKGADTSLWPVYSRRLDAVDCAGEVHPKIDEKLQQELRVRNAARHIGVRLIFASDARLLSMQAQRTCDPNATIPAMLHEQIQATVVGADIFGGLKGGTTYVGLTFDEESTKRLMAERSILAHEIGFRPRPRYPHFSVEQFKDYRESLELRDQIRESIGSAGLTLSLGPVERNISLPYGTRSR